MLKKICKNKQIEILSLIEEKEKICKWNIPTLIQNKLFLDKTEKQKKFEVTKSCLSASYNSKFILCDIVCMLCII